MKGDRTVLKALTLIMQFGINMLVPIFLCSFAGLFIDKKFGTSWVFIAGFILGAVAGGRNVYIFAKDIMNSDSDSKKNGQNKGR
ncbi:MAG: AtpZ/AtpI family protein [Lachnospiraceae bacterium]|nr:AtpZ/AtpI family protein [Lachnospiraceae bacterium]MBR4992670.1 AtpZ/AtpI family protein [Lachnospiraceae bacterium]